MTADLGRRSMASKDRPENLVDMFEGSVARNASRKLFGTKNKAGEYEWVTYEQVGRMVDDLRAGMADAGIAKGDTVGLIANNRTEWAVIAFATFGLGARFVPMYEAELTSNWRRSILSRPTSRGCRASASSKARGPAPWPSSLPRAKRSPYLRRSPKSTISPY
jgi:long-subunit acyl-CoA synthetase (AMP-forming)